MFVSVITVQTASPKFRADHRAAPRDDDDNHCPKFLIQLLGKTAARDPGWLDCVHSVRDDHPVRRRSARGLV
jgi:hypothetical protein